MAQLSLTLARAGQGNDVTPVTRPLPVVGPKNATVTVSGLRGNRGARYTGTQHPLPPQPPPPHITGRRHLVSSLLRRQQCPRGGERRHLQGAEGNAAPTISIHQMAALCMQLLVCSFTLVTCKLTFVTRAELFLQLANRHLLDEAQLQTLHNVPAAGVYRELVAKDCRAAYLNMRRASGLYVLWPKDSPPMAVYCDLSPEGGGWTLVQRNSLQNATFFGSGDWARYRDGFGDLTGDHWLGNELIHGLTKQSPFTVRFLLVDSEGNKYHADYSSFRVDSEERGYTLRVGDYSGNAGDALTIRNDTGTHDNMKFSTADRDNDRWSDNCAQESGGGGWWFDKCHSAFLNTDRTLYWGGLCGESRTCRAASIMVKPGKKNCSPIPGPGAGEYPPIHYR